MPSNNPQTLPWYCCPECGNEVRAWEPAVRAFYDQQVFKVGRRHAADMPTQSQVYHGECIEKHWDFDAQAVQRGELATAAPIGVPERVYG